MKVSYLLLALALYASLVTAAPPRGGFQRFGSFSQSQEVAASDPPYPHSGWKPEKPFYLPGEGEVTTEKDAEVITTTPEATETTTQPSESEPEAAPSIPVDARNKLTSARQIQIVQPPYYYLLLPRQQTRSPAANVRSNYRFLIPDRAASPASDSYVLRDVEAFGAPLYFLGDQGGLLVRRKERR